MTEVNRTKILDLDDYVPADRAVVIAKKEYRIKGNASLESTLKVMAASEAWTVSAGDPKALKALIDAVKCFFIDGIDDGILESLDLKTQVPKLIAFLYGADNKDEKDDGKNEPGKPSE